MVQRGAAQNKSHQRGLAGCLKGDGSGPDSWSGGGSMRCCRLFGQRGGE